MDKMKLEKKEIKKIKRKITKIKKINKIKKERIPKNWTLVPDLLRPCRFWFINQRLCNMNTMWNILGFYSITDKVH